MTTENGCAVTDDATAALDALRARRAANRDAHAAATGAPGGVLPEVAEYRGLPLLVVPFNAADDGRRPLDGRPGRAAPLRSASLRVTEPGSDAPVDRLRPGRPYELTADVRNLGDMDVPPTVVEFFADHRPAELAFDTTDGVIRLRPGRTQTFTGWTTLPPGTALEFALEYQRGVAGGASAQFLTATVRPDRTFAVTVDSPDFDVYDPATDSLAISTLEAPRVEAEVVVGQGSVTEPGPVPLSVNTANAEFVGLGRTRLPAGRTTTVSTTYTTPARGDRVLGAFYVRAYSLVPLDVPDRWGVLDHRQDRHVGRTEVHWI